MSTFKRAFTRTPSLSNSDHGDENKVSAKIKKSFTKTKSLLHKQPSLSGGTSKNFNSYEEVDLSCFVFLSSDERESNFERVLNIAPNLHLDEGAKFIGGNGGGFTSRSGHQTSRNKKGAANSQSAPTGLSPCIDLAMPISQYSIPPELIASFYPNAEDIIYEVLTWEKLSSMAICDETIISSQQKKKIGKKKSFSSSTIPSVQSIPPPGSTIWLNVPQENLTHRLINLNVSLTSEELDFIDSFRSFQKQKNVLLPSYMDTTILRFINHCGGNVKKALRLCQRSFAWRRSTLHSNRILDTDIVDYLNKGYIYLAGRDYAMRPTIVIVWNRLVEAQWDPEKVTSNLVYFLLEYISTYMLLPGKVESFNVFVDLETPTANPHSTKTITLDARTKLRDLVTLVSKHYVGRIGYIFCHQGGNKIFNNLHSFIETICDSIFIEVATRCVLLSPYAGQHGYTDLMDNEQEVIRSNHSSIYHYYNPSQLEVKYGGIAPNFTRFYPFIFPNPNGPFSLYSSEKSNYNVPNAHRILCRETVCGSLWERENHANLELMYAEDAFEIFKALNLDTPRADLIYQNPDKIVHRAQATTGHNTHRSIESAEVTTAPTERPNNNPLLQNKGKKKKHHQNSIETIEEDKVYDNPDLSIGNFHNALGMAHDAPSNAFQAEAGHQSYPQPMYTQPVVYTSQPQPDRVDCSRGILPFFSMCIFGTRPTQQTEQISTNGHYQQIHYQQQNQTAYQYPMNNQGYPSQQMYNQYQQQPMYPPYPQQYQPPH